TIHPLEIPDWLKSKGDLLLDPATTTPMIFDSLVWLLTENDQRPAAYLEDIPLLELYSKAAAAGGREKSLAEAIRKVVAALQSSATGIQKILDRLTEHERAFLVDSFKVFLLEEEEAVNRSAAEQDSLQKLSDSLAVRFKDIGPKIDLAGILSYQAGVVAAYADLAAWLKEKRSQLLALGDAKLEHYFPELQTSVGRVAISGRGNDHYDGHYALIIDLAGDDEYHLTADADHHDQVIIDLSGNDTYIAESDFALGSGFIGCGILDDWQGDDIYRGKHFSLGCGLFGTGILIDRAGNDYYRGDICSQAAASFGIGLLADRAGDDTYDAKLFSQGFGFIMGIGALVDNSGNDNYRAGWKYGDVLRYENHYLSLSQGFGYGLRPHFSGGIGLLIDGDGHDTYNADIFGQGASYWWALGGLIDYSGTDRYVAHQYAQGSATHLCLAALVDLAGHDLYSAKGVSQGCGHDLAFGLLLDCSGDDQYHAYDLSQAAGSANGVGMLVDLEGNDGYLVRTKRNTHGYGNPRRDYGSIGLHLDLNGVDTYSGYGADNSYWITNSKWGIGADLTSGETDDK
ncbi:MAG: hypothetical protein KAT58_11500, partial [candidate division Zixibacteria bacterium]|nr:hypothetical protein [candidate division Zixibacteria bacterium]